MMTNARKRRLWRARVAEYRASELSVRAWCEKNGVTENALRYWLGKIGESEESVTVGADSRAAWARLEIVGDGGQSGAPAGQAWAGGPTLSVRVGAAAIDVRPGFDPKLLSDVLRVVLLVSKAQGLATC